MTETTPLAAPDDAPAAPVVPDEVRRRLSPLIARDPMSWVWTAAVALIAATLRLVGLAFPGGKVFDEQHYVKHAETFIDRGIEWNVETNGADYVVHPPLGKWCIALGEMVFGRNEFGWRIGSVVAGVAAVVIITRLARRMFGSTVLGCAAGLLMALDGFQFVLSRFALLDIFLLLFVVASFACLVADRDQRRGRWLSALEEGRLRPRFSVPWWRIASAVLLGCALSVKWSAVTYAIGFVIMFVAWEIQIRRTAGVKRPIWNGFLDELGWVALYTLTTIVTYVSSWFGWFASDQGWGRHWLRDNGHSEPPVIGALYNLFKYHRDMLTFHEGLSDKHPYQSWPMEWLLLGRPVAFHYTGDAACGAPQCASEVVLLGTPLLWWSFIPALFAVAWFGLSRRDWRAWPILGFSLLGVFIPWVFYPKRTMFYFYAAPAEPFLILAVTFVLGVVAGQQARSVSVLTPDRPARRRTVGAVIAGSYLGVIAVCFAYFYPIYTGQAITYASWWARMWLGNHWV